MRGVVEVSHLSIVPDRILCAKARPPTTVPEGPSVSLCEYFGEPMGIEQYLGTFERTLAGF
jgi:hypothetical protein